MAKKIIKITENELYRIISKSVNNILEKKYRSYDNKMKIAQYLSGKDDDAKKKEWQDILSKRAAIHDINKHRNVSNMDDNEQEFNNMITSKTFNIDFDDLNYDYYNDDDMRFGI
ncbi:MAG: hypothetical protein IKT40_12580 [Bacilli bacterium]|nr:hypothetical protein [Bacilli bacterium]